MEIDLGPLIFAVALVFMGLLFWLMGDENKRHAQIADVADRRYHLLIRAYRVLEMYCPHDPLIDDIEEELDWEFINSDGA